QSDSGSVTFSKTVYLNGTSSGTGKLSDTATLTGSSGFTTSANASVDISSSKTASLEIDKTNPNVLQSGGPGQTFTFNVYDSKNNLVSTQTLTFKAGDTSKSVTISNLAPDTYTVKETTLTGWAPQDDQQVDLTSACSGTASFANKPSPALAAAI